MKKRLQERIEQRLTLVERVEGESGRRVKAIGITANVTNANRRRYPAAVLQGAVAKLNLAESAGQGRLVALGEAEHPGDKSGRPNLLETVVKWEASSFDGSHVLLEGVILSTRAGQDVATLLEAGVPVGVSMRGYGETRTVRESGRKVDEVTELTITGFDLVAEPSDPDARLTESREATKMEEEEQKKLQEALDAERKEKEALQKQLDEANKSKVELDERKRQEAVEAAITESTKDLNYGDGMNGMFVKSIRAAKPESPEAVKALVESKRKEYDELAAAWKLARMGKGVQMTAPVFERETGQASFTRPAWELTEAVVRSENRQRRNLTTGESAAERFAVRYLELFDRNYKAQLMAEARAFEEAEQTSDLNLPYSVMRSIVEQVWPELVAANVYDIGVATQSPERLYFETYAGESGATATVADEAVTGDHGNWVALANGRLTIGSVVLTNSGATVTYTEGTDYVVDYGQGKIMTLASPGTTTDGQSLLIDYGYSVMRAGEMAAIQRGKNTLSYKTLEIEADRMAIQISSEAIVFSRSQLGYDALGRTLSNLMRQVQRKIDEGMHYLAIASAVQQANNSGGTWTAASDDVIEFVEKIGVAKVKVENRYYQPTSIVMSKTNADRLSNWDGFTRLGFPNAILNAAGYAGGVKGLPIFSTPTFSDKYVLICNREIVMHRVFQAMQLKGPYPTYSSDKLVAADQYYIEEYNGTDAPVVEKAAYMIVA
jgi:hypothetical protein